MRHASFTYLQAELDNPVLAHEFGHGLGLDHPGVGKTYPPGHPEEGEPISRSDEYEEDGITPGGGKTRLMGVMKDPATVTADEYNQAFAEHIKVEGCPDCNWKATRPGKGR